MDCAGAGGPGLESGLEGVRSSPKVCGGPEERGEVKTRGSSSEGPETTGRGARAERRRAGAWARPGRPASCVGCGLARGGRPAGRGRQGTGSGPGAWGAERGRGSGGQGAACRMGGLEAGLQDTQEGLRRLHPAQLRGRLLSFRCVLGSTAQSDWSLGSLELPILGGFAHIFLGPQMPASVSANQAAQFCFLLSLAGDERDPGVHSSVMEVPRHRLDSAGGPSFMI